VEAPEEFTKALQKDPKLLNRLKKKAELDEFKGLHNLERATPLKCPACSQWGMTGGSLWIHKEDRLLFTCRKCKITWRIECQTIPNEELIYQIREVQKGEEGEPSDKTKEKEENKC